MKGKKWTRLGAMMLAFALALALVPMSALADGETASWGTFTQRGSGYVVDSATDAPISGATVNLYDRNDTSVVKYSGTTAPDGSFRIYGIEPGSYSYEVTADGYESTGILTGNGINGLSRPGDGNCNNNIRLTAKASATVSGKVTDENGVGLRGAGLQLQKGSVDVGSMAYSGMDGSYTLKVYEPGTYTIEVVAKGYEQQTVAAFEVQNTDITGKDVQMRLVAIDTGRVMGKITSSDTGSGIAATVTLFDSNGTISQIVTCQPDGTYSFELVPVGIYTIQAGGKGYATQDIPAFTVSAGATVTGKDVALASAPITTLSVSGQVKDQNGNGMYATVGLYEVGVPLAWQAKPTSADGTYTFTDVAPGTYYVSALQTGYATTQSQIFVAQSGVDVQVPDITMETQEIVTADVSGKIVGTDAPNGVMATVSLMQGSTYMQILTCQPDGSYTFKDVDPGTYTLRVIARNYATQSTAEFTVEPKTDKVMETITLTPAPDVRGTVSGTVYNAETGEPIQASLGLVRKGEQLASHALTCQPDGSFTFKDVYPGTYTLQLVDYGFGSASSAEFVVGEGQEIKNLNLYMIPLTQGGTLVRGTVVNGLGNGISATVKLMSGTDEVQSVQTDDKGVFIIKNAAAGVYTLQILTDDYDPYITNAFTLSQNEAMNLLSIYPGENKTQWEYDFQGVERQEIKMTNPSDITVLEHVDRVGTHYLNRINTQMNASERIAFTFEMTAGANNLDQRFYQMAMPHVKILNADQSEVIAAYDGGNGKLKVFHAASGDPVTIGVEANVLEPGEYVLVFDEDFCGNNASRRLGVPVKFQFKVVAGQGQTPDSTPQPEATPQPTPSGAPETLPATGQTQSYGWMIPLLLGMAMLITGGVLFGRKRQSK